MLAISLFLLFLVLFVYVLYPLLTFIVVASGVINRKEDVIPPKKYPGATLLIPGHNIADIIPAKLENLAKIHYPGALTIVFVLDGCTDETENVISSTLKKIKFRFPVEIAVSHERVGKEAALLDAIRNLSSEVLVFSDADAMLEPDTILHLVNRLTQPKVGVACGLEIHSKGSSLDASQGQSLFYKYENFLKQNLTRVSSLCYVQGGNFAMWRELYPIENPIPAGATQDGIIAFDAVLKGFRIEMEPRAVTYEDYKLSSSQDFSRRVRTISRAFFSVICRPAILNPLKSGWFSFHLMSGRVLRWFALPLAVLGLVTGLLSGVSWYAYLLLIAFVIWTVVALAGWFLEIKKRRIRPIYLVFYLSYVHIAAAWAVARVILGKRTAVWKPSTQ